MIRSPRGAIELHFSEAVLHAQVVYGLTGQAVRRLKKILKGAA